MAEQGQEQQPARPERRSGRGGLWLLLTLACLLAAAALAAMALTGRTISAPDWVVDRVEARANAALSDRLTVRIGGLEVLVDPDFTPHLRLNDVRVVSPSRAELARLGDVRTTLDLRA